jgi:hypothetical protein
MPNGSRASFSRRTRKPAIADRGSGRRRWPSFVSERQWPLIHDPPQAISPPIDQRYGKRVTAADFFCRQLFGQRQHAPAFSEPVRDGLRHGHFEEQAEPKSRF